MAVNWNQLVMLFTISCPFCDLTLYWTQNVSLLSLCGAMGCQALCYKSLKFIFLCFFLSLQWAIEVLMIIWGIVMMSYCGTELCLVEVLRGFTYGSVWVLWGEGAMSVYIQHSCYLGQLMVSNGTKLGLHMYISWFCIYKLWATWIYADISWRYTTSLIHCF